MHPRAPRSRAPRSRVSTGLGSSSGRRLATACAVTGALALAATTGVPAAHAETTPTSPATPDATPTPGQAPATSGAMAPAADPTATATGSLTPSTPASSSPMPSASASSPASGALLSAPSTLGVCLPLTVGGTARANTTVSVDLLTGGRWITGAATTTSSATGGWHATVTTDSCYLGTQTVRARSGSATALASTTRTGTAPTYTIAAAQASHTGGGLYRSWGPVTVTGRVSVAAASDVWLWGMARDRRSAVRLGHATSAANGSYSITVPFPATSIGSLFVDSGRGAGTQRSALLPVTAQAASATLSSPTTTDASTVGYVSGSLTPGTTSRARVVVQVYRGGRWVQVVQGAVTGTTFRLPWTTTALKNLPGLFQLRAGVTQPDGTVLWTRAVLARRVAQLDAVVRPTTAADVAKTYRAGCPVGPSRLSTITMNYLSYDGTVRRGVLIVRSDLAGRVVAAFGRGIAGGFPLKSLNNPNVYGGDDVTMMKAGNTSAFNCRHVTGNPYALSPHSYGKAIDVNTIENPYRDPQGRWYPSTAYSTVRPASVKGLLTSTSSLTLGLRGQGYAWFSGWDWQHFEAS